MEKIIEKNENNINNIRVFFDSTSNLFFLFIKSFFRSSAFAIVCILIPIILTFSLLITIPISYCFSWIIFITLSFASFSSYGVLYFNFRNSNAYKNLELTNVTIASIYFSILSTMFIIVFITLLFDLFFVWFCIQINIVSNAWSFQASSDTTFSYDMSKIQWSVLFYYWINIIVLVFSMSFVIQEITRSQKGFFVFVFIFIIAGLFLGGTFSPTVYIDPEDNLFKVMDVETLGELDAGEQIGAYIETYVWGGPGWELSQLFPTYGLNQVMFGSFNPAVTTYASGVAQPNLWDGKNIFQMMLDSSDDKILYYIIMPWIWAMFNFWFGGFLSVRKHSN